MNAPLRYLVLTAAVIIGGMSLGLSLKSSESDPQKEFIGQDSCMSCHAGPFAGGRSYAGAAAFRETMHQKIHLRPNPQTVVIDRLFAEGRVLKFVDSRINDPGHDTLEIHLSKGAAPTDYYIQLSFSGTDKQTPKMKVAYTYGGNGWIQRYLLDVNGDYYIAPFQYALPRYKERTDTSEGFYLIDHTRWYTLDSDRSPTFFAFDSKIFKQQSWRRNCSYCHVNGYSAKRVVTGKDTTYDIGWFGTDKGDSALIDQNIKIGCESCHGPGSLHAANPSDPATIVSPSRWAPDGPGEHANLDLKVDLCGQCHNRMNSTAIPRDTVDSTGNPLTVYTKPWFTYPYDEVNQRAYMPGMPLKQFVYKGNVLYGATVWGDQQLPKAHHQQGQDFLRSPSYQAHVFSNGCWSCHTVHYNNEQGLPFQLRTNYYSLESGEGCLAFGCHENFNQTTTFKGRTVNAHSMHSQDVSQCVNCHFMKSATISFVELKTKPYYDFSDHSLRVFRPRMTKIYANGNIAGMPNVCAEACHRNGRGSRNSDPTSPVAPSFGITDRFLDIWGDKTDFQLADSLEAHWAEMFPAEVVRESAVAGSTAIQSVVPNPATGTTTIRFSVALPGSINLAVYDTRGNLITLLASGRQESGTFAQTWDLTDETGKPVPAGVYMVRLTTKQGASTQRLVVAR